MLLPPPLCSRCQLGDPPSLAMLLLLLLLPAPVKGAVRGRLCASGMVRIALKPFVTTPELQELRTAAEFAAAAAAVAALPKYIWPVLHSTPL
jgi:hypothetical protein